MDPLRSSEVLTPEQLALIKVASVTAFSFLGLAWGAVFWVGKFSFLGFEFEGASGPVVLWVLCFLAQMFGIWLLWNRSEPRRASRETPPVTDTLGAPSPP